MADNKPSTNNYRLLAGVDTKRSEYDADAAGFQDLRNLDFYIPNALSKRPGSTQAVSAGTSGPINSLFEFQKLDGTSYVIAGSDTAMFLASASGYSLLSSGWTNGQPTDMLTFVDKLWMANGQKWESWGATGGAGPVQAGLPMQTTVIIPSVTDFNGATNFLVGGATMNPVGTTFVLRGVYVAYSYVRNDGYQGPANFLDSARNIIRARPTDAGDEYFDDVIGQRFLAGITIPAGYGISAINIWMGVDTVASNSATLYLDATWGVVQAGQLGWYDRTGGINSRRMSSTLIPSADTTRFHLVATVPGASIILGAGYGPIPSANFGTDAYYIASMTGFAGLDSVATGDGFSGMVFDFFATYIPKYLEQNNNVMFYSGFSFAPSLIQFSEIGQPEITQPNYNFEIRTNDGDRITGTKTYNSTVVVTKERSFAKIIGSTPEDLEVVELSTEYGCLSNKTMIEYNQKLCWLDRRGILEFNGSTWNIISTPVEPIFRRMNLSAARDKACAVNHLYRNQVWFGIPIDGSTQNNITVVFDYLVGAWTFFDGFNPASFALVKGALNTPTAWTGDYSGLVHYFGESFFSDNGRGITCLGLPNWEIDRGQNATSLWRRFFLDVGSNSSGVTGVINAKIFANYDASTIQATFTMYQNQFQSRADFGVPAKSISIQFSHYSASLPLVINGFSWTKRYLRNV